METQICIVGAGPAGLMAAIFAAEAQAQVLIIERNTTAGRKLLKTGRGRCNFTHTGSIDEFVRAYGACGRFLKPALYAFSPEQVRRFFQERNLAGKVEKDGCVFPVSDRASDVCKILLETARERNVQFLFGRRVERITQQDYFFLVHTDKQSVRASAVILAAGGASWPATGSTGDGYHLAAAFGHSIMAPKPALCPLVTEERWACSLQGIGIPHVSIRAAVDGRTFQSEGPVMFTSEGLGGPAVFNLSRHLTDFLSRDEKAILHLDFLPELDIQTLQNRLISECAGHPKKEPAGILSAFLPRQVCLTLQNLLWPGGSPSASQLTREQRDRLVHLLKSASLTVVKTAPLEQATITRGGISRNEIEPTSMESRLCPNLFFAGEVIDADGPCGGYNLQIAWSTGALAGTYAAKIFQKT